MKMINTSSNIPSKIQSFFDKGFLPGGGTLDVVRSFDTTSRHQVSLNCISSIEGIATSLLHQAKGGLTVMLEEKVGGEGILDKALKRNKKAISEKKDDFAFIGPSLATAAARKVILEKDKEFLTALCEKVHSTALFVLDIEPHTGENESKDVCREVGRSAIPPEKIEAVYVSEKIMTECENKKIIPISSKSMKINFSYKDEMGQPQTMKDLGPIDVPDYAGVLLELSEQKTTSLNEEPIYTHMTRL